MAMIDDEESLQLRKEFSDPKERIIIIRKVLPPCLHRLQQSWCLNYELSIFITMEDDEC